MKLFWQIFSLSALVLTRPIFLILSENIEFLVAWHAAFFEIFILVLIIYLLIPTVIFLLILTCFRIDKHLGIFFSNFFLISAIFSFNLSIFNKIIFLNNYLILLVSLLLTLLIFILFKRKRSIKKFLIHITPLTLIFPIILINSLNSKNFFGSNPSTKNKTNKNTSSKKTSVVLIVFDELPLITLLNKKGFLDKTLFPNIVNFANNSTWFINAKSVSHETIFAVPSILSGLKEKRERIPNLHNYPNNLFTLLSSTHDIKAIESGTELIPINPNNHEPPFGLKLLGITYDLTLTYLHVITPKNLVKRLPSIEGLTHDFGKLTDKTDFLKNVNNLHDEKKISDPKNKFLKFIETSKHPSFLYLHVVFPHFPWTYLPSGKIHGPMVTGGFEKETWVQNIWTVEQGYQQHLLQVMYADKVFGEIISKLKKEKKYKESLIFFIADHGAGFWPGQGRRKLETTKKENLDDLYGIPLILKLPGLEKGLISPLPASTSDILPTIADALKIAIDFPVEGRSLLLDKDKFVPLNSFSLSPYKYNNSLKRKIAIFDKEKKGIDVYKIGKYFNLIGKPIIKENHKKKTTNEITIDNIGYYENVDLNSNFLPARITGKFIENTEKGKRHLAIGLNGKIESVTETVDDNKRFSSIIPENAFKNGDNKLDFFEIKENGKKIEQLNFKKIQFKMIAQDKILDSNGKELLISLDNNLKGNVDIIKYEKSTNSFTFWGWAADIKEGSPVDKIILKIRNVIQNGGTTGEKRTDVAKAFNKVSLENSGFFFSIPRNYFSVRLIQDIQFIAIKGKEAKAINIDKEKFKSILENVKIYNKVNPNWFTRKR